MSYKTVMMRPEDNVAVALETIPVGTQLTVRCQDLVFEVGLKDEIEFGHKFAVVSIERGEDIFKYGEPIGVSTAFIAAGEHVHVHNLEGKRGRGDRVVKST